MKFLISVLLISFMFSMASYAEDARITQTPSEIYVETPHFDVSIWKQVLYNAQIHIYDGDNTIKVLPCFLFGNNSGDGKRIQWLNRNNGYKMFIGKVEKMRIEEHEDRIIVNLSYPRSFVVYDKTREFVGDVPSRATFSTENTITIYYNKPRVDIEAKQVITEDLHTHLSWFSHFYFDSFSGMLFGTDDQYNIEPGPWSKLKFMYLTPEGKASFEECHEDEKGPFKNLHTSEGFNDYFVAQSGSSSYFVYCPSWRKYADLSYNRKKMPSNSILFHTQGSKKMGRIIMITKDTTLGAGLDVLDFPKGEYINRISVLKLPQNADNEAIKKLHSQISQKGKPSPVKKPS